MLAVGGSGKLPTTTRVLGAHTKPSDANTSQPKVNMPTSQRVVSRSQSVQHRHIWIVTGPAGCGKTTVAASLAGQLGVQYIEGDDVSQIFSSDLP